MYLIFESRKMNNNDLENLNKMIDGINSAIDAADVKGVINRSQDIAQSMEILRLLDKDRRATLFWNLGISYAAAGDFVTSQAYLEYGGWDRGKAAKEISHELLEKIFPEKKS
ncbi:hypothetical protein [Streptacidiphilus rugosus]|uniref:hypothetical protein n=1 Tax=Streptacidiphilus rugosus TaxID=405783 RepID=UPI0012FA011A|nr:hypothetical protein [Streptacidiphilus rugosus]